MQLKNKPLFVLISLLGLQELDSVFLLEGLGSASPSSAIQIDITESRNLLSVLFLFWLTGTCNAIKYTWALFCDFFNLFSVLVLLSSSSFTLKTQKLRNHSLSRFFSPFVVQ
jgi:hypothetical protein